jgi:hypothetical protein
LQADFLSGEFANCISETLTSGRFEDDKAIFDNMARVAR